MPDQDNFTPDQTAVGVALWRAQHLLIDPPPYVIEDELGLRLADPGEGWCNRPDMNPAWTGRNSGSIIARAQYIEDLVIEQATQGIDQYVSLGAGLDTFAQRRADIVGRMTIFEIDRPAPQRWKQQRLVDLGYGVPDHPRFVPVDFEAGAEWLPALVSAGFDRNRPAVVASAGVSLYLTRAANLATLTAVAGLAERSMLGLSFMVPLELVDPDEFASRRGAERGARASGSPMISFFSPEDFVALAREAGFRQAQHVSHGDLAARYFSGRTDGLRPSSSEQILVAQT
jgi:methyltransferase (TIGR00027 family)